MMPERLARYATTLNGLERKGRRRKLVQQDGIDFTSNDYLGLARSPRIRAAPLPTRSSAVLPSAQVAPGCFGATIRSIRRLKRRLPPSSETERALYFSSGYAANTALFSTLPQRGDLVVHDALVHASAHEGIAASRAAAVPVRHNDVQHFDDAIRRWRDAGGMGHPWLAVESLYSMDGDRAPLAELLKLADRHDGFLVIDEAHATGVFGPNGRGLAAGMEGRDNVILLHTCGKALGVAGALVGANSVVCEYLINRARGFIYSTAPSPLMAASVRKALKILADEPERRAKFEQLWTFANAQLTAALGFEGSGSQILPVMIGDNSRAMRIAARMRAEGFDIRAIRPPTVPEGTARLRIAITLNVDRSAIVRMFDALANVFIEEAA